MHLFLSEFLTSGALPAAERSPSLLREGRAMLLAVVRDLAGIPGFTVQTTLAPEVEVLEGLPLQIERVADPLKWPAVFEAGCRAADACLIIAPESGGVLAEMVRRAWDFGRPVWNCSPPAIELCTDKLRLAEHLQQAGVATISTQRVGDWTPPAPADLPVVVKPRDGAGSHWVRRISTPAEWQRLAAEFPSTSAVGEPLWQPWIAGQALSLAGLFDASGQCAPLLFPAAEQHLTSDGRFAYQGGRLPARITPDAAAACCQLVLAATAAVEGLHGYVGFDLILPPDDPARPVIVEINPRLTTSMVGYQSLSQTSLFGTWLSSSSESLSWKPESIQFAADGRVS